MLAILGLFGVMMAGLAADALISGHGDGADELFWYTPGTGPDYLWTGIIRTGAPTSRPVAADGVATPVVGDYDHNGFDDIFWYS